MTNKKTWDIDESSVLEKRGIWIRAPDLKQDGVHVSL